MTKTNVVASATKTNIDTPVSKNIQKRSSGLYRVRVCGDSVMCTSKAKAFAARKELYTKHGK